MSEKYESEEIVCKIFENIDIELKKQVFLELEKNDLELAVEIMKILRKNDPEKKDTLNSGKKTIDNIMREVESRDEFISAYLSFLKTVLPLAEKIWYGGLVLTLEDYADNEDGASWGIFNHGIRLFLGGVTDEERIEKELSDLIEKEDGNEYSRRLGKIQMEGALAILNKDSSRNAHALLNSYTDMSIEDEKYYEAHGGGRHLKFVEKEISREKFVEECLNIKETTKNFVKKSRREGILSLCQYYETPIMGSPDIPIYEEKVKARDLFHYGLSFFVDGHYCDFVEKVLSNILEQERDTDEYSNKLKIFQKEAALAFWKGINLVGELDPDEYYSKRETIQKDVSIGLNFDGVREISYYGLSINEIDVLLDECIERLQEPGKF